MWIVLRPQYGLAQSCACQKHRVKLGVITMEDGNPCPGNLHLQFLSCCYFFIAD